MTESIKVIGTSGREGKSEGQFAQPRGVCINKVTKELFIVDCNNHRIQVFHLLSLSFIRQIAKGSQGSAPGFLMYPVGICMDESNQLYVADTNNHRIVVFNHITGSYVRSIGAQGTSLGCLNCPYGVYVDSVEGYLYVADYENNRIQVFDCETGNFVKIYGNGQGTGPGQFNQPIDVCLDHDFDYVIIADYSNNRVQVLNKSTGAYVRSIGSNSGSDALNGPRALCINRETNLLFISDRENHRIQLYNKTTYTLLRQIGQGLGVNPGQFNRPMELCVDNEEGVLIVVDGYNHRVQIIELPELQAEKTRLKSLKQKKSNVLLSKSVRPSLIAVNAHLNLSDAKMKDTGSGYITIEYPTLGAPYIFTLTKAEAALLSKIFPTFSQQLTFDLTDTALEDGLFLEKSVSRENLLKQQAEVFLGVLESLAAANTEDSMLMMTAPSVVALHALLLRGWSSHRFPFVVADLILNLIVNIDQGATSYSETKKLLIASSELLKSAVSKHPSLLKEFIPSLLTALKQLIHDSIDITEFLALRDKTLIKSSSESNLKSIGNKSLLCLFDILSCAFQLYTYGSSFNGTVSDSYDRSTIATKTDGAVDHQTIDMIFLIFGVDYSSYPARVHNRESSINDEAGYTTMQIPSSFIAAIESIFRLLEMDESSFSLSRSSRHVNSRPTTEIIQNRTALFDHFTTYLREVHQVNRGKDSKKEKKLRGGRNIWDGLSPIQPGDLLDCMDKEKSWFESLVTEVSLDGGVKIHFMGWGSKWDDLILPAEIAVRIAPLNTYTKDWRSELFEGGLIEIKCNDDLVNQKWMWGKITRLNKEESWLEVAYSFSNEPVVIKKAWLWGETICPVGMHTKDKSRAAAALISKPEKTMAEMLKEKVLDEIPENEFCLFDSEDDYYDNPEVRFDRGLSTGLIGGSSLSLSMLNLSSPNRERATGEGVSPVTALGEILFVRLSKEIMLAISDTTAINGGEVGTEILEQQSQSLVALVRCLTTLPCTRLVYQYILKPIYFQAGGRAKLLAFPARHSRELSFQDSSTESAINQFASLSESLIQLQQRYVGFISRLFNSAFSTPSAQYVIEKLQSTILYCGFTPLANDIISSFIENDQLLFKAFQPLLSNERFKAKHIATRKLFRSIISAASSDQVEKLLLLIEQIMIRKQVQVFTSIDYFKQFVGMFQLESKDDTSKTVPHSRKNNLEVFKFLDQFSEQCLQTKSIISQEILHSNRIQFSVERILSQELSVFDNYRSELLAEFLSQGLFSLIFRSPNVPSKVIFDDDYAIISGYVEKALQILSYNLNEKIFYSVYESFLHSYWMNYVLRSADGFNSPQNIRLFNVLPNQPSIPWDLVNVIVQIIPYGGQIRSSLYATVYSQKLTQEFLLEQMNKDDEALLEESCLTLPSNSFTEYLWNGGQFNVSCLDRLRLPKLFKTEYFQSMKLPSLLNSGFDAFEKFYLKKIDPSSVVENLKRLHWCKGFGQLTVDCIINNRKYFEMTITEAQLVILEKLGQAILENGLSVIDLAKASCLSLEITKLVLQSLMENSIPLIMRKVPLKSHQKEFLHLVNDDDHSRYLISEKDLTNSVIQFMSIHSQRVSIDYTEKFFSLLHSHATRKIDGKNDGVVVHETWEDCKIDASLLRILKNSSFEASEAMVSLTILAIKCKELLRKSLPFIEETQIIKRVFRLIEKGYIYQNVSMIHMQKQEILLSYFPIESDLFPEAFPNSSNPGLTMPSSPSREAILPSVVTLESFINKFFIDIHSTDELSKLFQQIILNHAQIGNDIAHYKDVVISSKFYFDYAVLMLAATIQQTNLLFTAFKGPVVQNRNHTANPPPCIDVFLALLQEVNANPSESLLARINWCHYLTLAVEWKYEIYNLFTQLTSGLSYRISKEMFVNSPNTSIELVLAMWETPINFVDPSRRQAWTASHDFPSGSFSYEEGLLIGLKRFISHNLVEMERNLHLKELKSHRTSSHSNSTENDNDEEKDNLFSNRFQPESRSITLNTFFKLLIDYLTLDMDISSVFSTNSPNRTRWHERSKQQILRDVEPNRQFHAREDQTYHSTITHSPSRVTRGFVSEESSISPYRMPLKDDDATSFPSSSSLYSSPYRVSNRQSGLIFLSDSDACSSSRPAASKDFVSDIKDKVKDYKSRVNQTNFTKSPSSSTSNITGSPAHFRVNHLLTAEVVQDLFSEENFSLHPKLSFGSSLNLQSSNEQKSSSNYPYSPPISPFPIPARGLDALNQNIEFSPAHSTAAQQGIGACFLLPALRCFETKLKDYFSSLGLTTSSTKASECSNEQAYSFIHRSVNYVLFELRRMNPDASKLWWQATSSPVEEINSNYLDRILQAAFTLLKTQSDTRQENSSSTVAHKQQFFNEVLKEGKRNDPTRMIYQHLISSAIEITGLNWNQCCDIFQQSVYDFVDTVDSSFNLTAKASVCSFVGGADLLDNAVSLSWICFHCLKDSPAKHMVALKQCGHFACTNCWRNFLSPTLSAISNQFDSLDDHPSLLMRSFCCIRNRGDAMCSCSANFSLDLLSAVFQDDLTLVLPVLMKVYHYYEKEYLKYQTKLTEQTKQNQSIKSYLNLSTFKDSMLLMENEDKSSFDCITSSPLCCSLCIDYCLQHPVSQSHQKNVSVKQRSHRSHELKNQQEKAILCVEPEYYNHVALIKHSKNQSKISHYQTKIHSCEYSLHYCEDHYSFCLIQQQLQFWKLLLNCVYFYDHLFGEKNLTSSRRDERDGDKSDEVQDSIFSGSETTLQFAGICNDAVQQLQLLRYQEILDNLEDRMMQYLNSPEFVTPHTASSLPMNGHAEGSLSTNLQNSVLLSPSSALFSNLHQLVESVRGFHLMIFNQYEQRVLSSNSKQLFDVTKTITSMIQLKEQAVKEATEGASSVFGSSVLSQDDSMVLRSSYGQSPFISKLPSRVGSLVRNTVEKNTDQGPLVSLATSLKQAEPVYGGASSNKGLSSFLTELLDVLDIPSFPLTAGLDLNAENVLSLNEKLMRFNEKWGQVSKDLLHERSLLNSSKNSPTDVIPLEKMLQAFYQIYRKLIVLDSLFSLPSLDQTSIPTYLLQNFEGYLKLFHSLMICMTSYCKHNIQSALDIYTIDISGSELAEISSHHNESTKLESEINIYSMFEILVTLMEKILQRSGQTPSLELLQLFNTSIEASVQWIHVVDEKILQHGYHSENNFEVKVDAVLPISISPSLTSSLLGSGMTYSIYKQLLLFYQQQFKFLQERLSLARQTLSSSVNNKEELKFDHYFDLLQKIVLNILTILYSTHRSLSALITGISFNINELNQKKDMFLMDICEYIWKEMLYWSNQRQQGHDRLLEEQIINRNRTIHSPSDSDDDDLDEDAVEDSLPSNTEEESEQKEETSNLLSTPTLPQQPAASHQTNTSLFEYFVSKYGELFLHLFYQMILIIKKRMIDKKYDTLNSISSTANARMKEEDKKEGGAGSELNHSNNGNITSTTITANHAEGNYILIISVIQRLLSTHHDISFVLLDYLFIGFPTASSQESLDFALSSSSLSSSLSSSFSCPITTQMMSEIFLELFTNHNFLFLLRTLMNPNSFTSSLRSHQLFLYYSPSQSNTTSYYLCPSSSHHDQILQVFTTFFDRYSTFPLPEAKIRRVSSMKESEEKEQKEPSLSSPPSSSISSSLLHRDQIEKVLIQYLPTSVTSGSGPSDPLYPIIYEFTLSEVLDHCKQMLWSLNILYSFWIFYFEYFFSSSTSTIIAATPSPSLLLTTTAPVQHQTPSVGIPANDLAMKSHPLIISFYQLLQQRKEHLAAISIHEYHEYSTTYYTKSYYHNSFILIQKLIELFYEKCFQPVVPSSFSSSSTPNLSSSAAAAAAAAATNTATRYQHHTDENNNEPMQSIHSTMIMRPSLGEDLKKNNGNRKKNPRAMIHPDRDIDPQTTKYDRRIEDALRLRDRDRDHNHREEDHDQDLEENILNLRLAASYEHHWNIPEEEQSAEDLYFYRDQTSTRWQRHEQYAEDAVPDLEFDNIGGMEEEEDEEDDERQRYHANDLLFNRLLRRNPSSVDLIRFFYLNQHSTLPTTFTLESDEDEDDDDDDEDEDDDDEDQDDGDEEEEEEDEDDEVTAEDEFAGIRALVALVGRNHNDGLQHEDARDDREDDANEDQDQEEEEEEE